jgi:hypothetical protein
MILSKSLIDGSSALLYRILHGLNKTRTKGSPYRLMSLLSMSIAESPLFGVCAKINAAKDLHS